MENCIAAFAVSSDGRAGAVAVGVVEPSSITVEIGSGMATGMKRSSELLDWFAIVMILFYLMLVMACAGGNVHGLDSFVVEFAIPQTPNK